MRRRRLLRWRRRRKMANVRKPSARPLLVTRRRRRPRAMIVGPRRVTRVVALVLQVLMVSSRCRLRWRRRFPARKKRRLLLIMWRGTLLILRMVFRRTLLARRKRLIVRKIRPVRLPLRLVERFWQSRSRTRLSGRNKLLNYPHVESPGATNFRFARWISPWSREGHCRPIGWWPR